MSYYLTVDARAVHQAALSLNIAEFELFSRAHAAWYCESACERDLERHFVSYLFDGEVPVWVRDFSRRIIREVRTGAGLTRVGAKHAGEWRVWLCACFGVASALVTGVDRSAPSILVA